MILKLCVLTMSDSALSSLQDAENGEMGRNESPAPTKTKVVGARKKYRSRSTSASSQDSLSSGSYSGKEEIILEKKTPD